jgi:transposase
MTRKEIEQRRIKWYKLFHEGELTYRQISRLYDVSRDTVITAINKVRGDIKNNGEQILNS